jgi:hypothetical protein
LGKAIWLLSALVVLVEGRAFAADVNLNVYGDVDYVVQRDPAGTTNSFASPRLELFLTATQDRLAFLAETMFEVGDNNEFSVDIERVEVAYIFADWFRVRAGRFHTAIGYYNDAYHHGRYFQTTVDRPEMVRFEDEGGLIPAHSVGLHADGRLTIGNLGSVRYDADLANGRGATPAEVTNLFDRNNGKMINFRLRLEPSIPDGLIVGANVLVDSIDAQPDPTMPATVFVRETMLGAHLAYLENNIHLIAEYLRVTHRYTGMTGITQAGFVEAGYVIRAFTPYVRGEVERFPVSLFTDPFFSQNVLAIRGSGKTGVAGLKFTASDYIALKLEGGYTKLDAGGSIRTGAVQCAFAF